MRRFLPVVLCLLLLSVSAHAQDLLGVRFTPDSFAPCRAHGCRVVSRGAATARLQLLRQDARLTLSLSPHGTVLGLDAWITAPRLTATQVAFLHVLAEQAAEQRLDPAQLRRCWQGVRPGQVRRVLGGGGEHYGVACLRQGVNHWGIRVYFDH